MFNKRFWSSHKKEIYFRAVELSSFEVKNMHILSYIRKDK